MGTLLLQSVVVPLLTLAFALAAAAVAGRARPEDPQGTAWRLCAVPFGLSGAHGLVHNAFALRAFFAPPESGAMEVWEAVKTVGNNGRGFLMLGFGAMLLVLLAAGRPLASLSVGRWAGVLLGWMALGSAVGLLEGSFTSTHYMVVALTSAAAVVCLLVALWLALVRDAVDWLLWTSLFVYTIREAVSVSMTSLFAWWEVPGTWMPSWRSLQELAVAGYVAMLGCACLRLWLAGRGVAVPALMEATERAALPRR